MKKITTILLLSLSLHSFSQTNETKIENTNTTENVSVTKSLFGVQIGFIGTWIYNELKLSDKIALRSELGLVLYTAKNSSTDESASFLAPGITLEPRFYYNLNKRNRKGKDISDNSGNYISLRNTYYPDSFTVGNTEGFKIVPELHIMPTWGMKRNLGKHFNYELSTGLGYRKVFEKDDLVNNNNEDVLFDIQARIGYKF
ncbi:hypothetical protein FEDK69T_16840 [Flavobacterium enshiense DK69]|uniref:Outer membrane protein beta-barrel domain-containing protein n=1 Tax=Flavobacterium enshiense DK69 TaxID=1107311 RepID=V6SA40_9FLAO|nr:hypothetical protein [Flavobacterium enshiense]ESU23516.1 hypothetical protein FEDK69T_16840 [Flavobacterium enshiense DK69]KGO96265.1 hypothetical protein Q767_04920 [Flavobacterium enshiense DK69]